MPMIELTDDELRVVREAINTQEIALGDEADSLIDRSTTFWGHFLQGQEAEDNRRRARELRADARLLGAVWRKLS